MPTPALPRPAAQSLLDVIRAWGVDRLFTCPGSTEAAFLDATLSAPDLRLYLTTHESITISMADGYSRATGQPAVAFLHANVGLTNGLSHLFAAKLAYSPLVVLNGLKNTSLQARQGFTTASHMRDFVRQYVKSDWQTLAPEALPEDVNRAFRLATGEPSGPSWLGLSQDVMEATIDAPLPEVERFRPNARLRPDPDQVAAAVELLAGARRPLLVAGSEVARHGATSLLASLAEHLGAPVVHEDRRGLERPAFPTDHPHFAGIYDVTLPCVRDADVLFFVGARCFLQFEPPARPELPSGVAVIHSHGDIAEVGRLYGADVGMVGHEQLVLADVLAALADSPVDPIVPAQRRTFLAEARADHLQRLPTRSPFTPGRPVSAIDVVDALGEVVDDSTTIVGDATTAASLLLRRLPQTSPQMYFGTASGSLGWGVGAALGLKMGLPDRHVVAVLGDGVFQFGIQALWAAAHYRIPVTYLVLNNESYAAVGASLLRYGGKAAALGSYPAMDISGPNIADIATGFGVPGVRITDPRELPAALRRARTIDGPTLIEVMTDPSDLGPSPV